MPRLPSVGGDNNNWGDILNEFLEVSHTGTGRHKFVTSSVAYSATITPDVDDYDILTIGALTDDITIANPAGTPEDGQLLILRFLQDGTGSHTVSWGNSYSFETSSSTPTIPNGANARWEMSFRWNSGTDKWELVSISSDEVRSRADISYTTSVPFTSLNGNMDPHTVSGAIAFTPDTDNAIPWAATGLRLTADGSNTPTFPGFKKANTSQSYDNTDGTVNVILFWYDGVDAWYSIYQDDLTALSAPGSFTATADGTSEIDLSWTDVSNESGYEIQRSLNGSSGWSTINEPAANATSYSDTGLSASTQYYYRIRALGDGVTYASSSWATANATTAAPDLTAPTLSSATIENENKDRILLTYNENLDTGSVPATSAYTVTVNGSGRSVSTVGVSGAVVTLTLASAAAAGDTVVVSYTPGASPIQDASGNDAAALTNQSVTNNISSYDSDAEAYFTAEEAAASITIDSTNKQAISDLIEGLKTDGIWTKIVALHLGYGTGLINAKTPGTLNATAPNGVTVNSLGYTFNGTNQYLNSQIIPANHLADSSESYGFYLRSNTADKCLLGVNDGSKSSYVFPQSSGSFVFRIQSGADLSGGANASAAGTYVISRRTGETIRAIKNGTQIHSTTVVATTPVATYPVYIGAYNNQGTAQVFNGATLGAFFISTELTNTEMNNAGTRIATFISATSRT